MVLRLGWMGTYVHAVHDDRDDVVGRGVIDLVHDQRLAVTEARLALDLGLPARFGLGLVLPLRLVSTSIEYLDAAGAEVELTRPGIHHRDETLTGLGDPMVLGGTGRGFGAWRVQARLGLTLPLGRTEEDPFALGDQGLAHQHVQMGTGTVNPVASVELSRAWGRWRAGAFAFTQQVLYTNGKGYRAGDRYAGGVSAARRLGARWTLRGGLDVQGETAERWNGTVHTDDGNRGRVDAMVGVGSSYKLSPALTVELGVKVPVITHVVGGQLDMPAIVELGVSWSPGASRPTGHPHDHGDHDDHGDDDGHGDHDDHDGHGDHGDHADHDDHGDHSDHADHDDHSEHADHADHDAAAPPDTTGLDIADLPEPTAGQPIAPVPGKITIVDVWATWCLPCKELEPVLVEMVRAHPDRVALRRVDVSDSTTWTIPLPYVQVYGAGGTIVLDRRSDGDLAGLITAVRAAVTPPPPRRR